LLTRVAISDIRRILIAFDKFKHAMEAEVACQVAADIVQQLRPGWECDLCPLTDGGEGFSKILTAACQGDWIEQEVTGPRGTKVEAGFGIVAGANVPAPVVELLGRRSLPSSIAIIEMALASGLDLLPLAERDPWLTDSFGTGELIAAAGRKEVEMILLGVGGSATNDLGVGALQALGLSALSPLDQQVEFACPAKWSQINRLEWRPDPEVPEILIACDVRNPLLGPEGCTAVYGGQKGLADRDQQRMELVLERMSSLMLETFLTPKKLCEVAGAGAAGGLGFGLACALGAQFVSGTKLVSSWLDLQARVEKCDLLFTGEGRFDRSSLSGKGPGGITNEARQMGKPVAIVCGSHEDNLRTPPGVELFEISPNDIPLEDALLRAPEFLALTVASYLKANYDA